MARGDPAEVPLRVSLGNRQRASILLALLVLAAFPADARRRSVAVRPALDETKLTTAEWVRHNAFPFATDAPQTGFGDLVRLPEIVGDARIVSLGEATHGTREFFRMKHRIFEYLVENEGFTIFAIEAAFAECDAINDFVLHGTGDAATALAGQHFWTWNTDEVLDLILWMRDYNLRRGAKPPVQFRGFDMQYSDVAIAKATAYLNRVDPSGGAAISSPWSCFVPYAGNRGNYLAQPSNVRRACATSLDAAHATIAERRAQYIAASSAPEYELMLRYARIIMQHEDLLVRTGIMATRHRDHSMAENTQWLANVAHPGERLVLWAHNFHVGASNPDTMGFTLRGMFPGEQMVIFGFAFHRGSFISRPLPGLGPPQPMSVTPMTTDVEQLFLDTPWPRFILALRDIESTAAQAFFGTPKSIWTIGAGFNPAQQGGFRENSILPNTYDAIIWFEESTPSRLRPF